MSETLQLIFVLLCLVITAFSAWAARDISASSKRIIAGKDEIIEGQRELLQNLIEQVRDQSDLIEEHLPHLKEIEP